MFLSLDQPLYIYPNPSEERFVIEIPAPERSGQALRQAQGPSFTGSATYGLSVYNSLGEVVFNENYRNHPDRLTIDLSSFSDGIYVVQMNVDGVVYSLGL